MNRWPTRCGWTDSAIFDLTLDKRRIPLNRAGVILIRVQSGRPAWNRVADPSCPGVEPGLDRVHQRDLNRGAADDNGPEVLSRRFRSKQFLRVSRYTCDGAKLSLEPDLVTLRPNDASNRKSRESLSLRR
jgi:hypothetical protein